MLVIRMQRTGRSGHAQFRVVVQDSRRTPTSGKIVAHLGHYDPHSKQTVIDKEKAQSFLEHGAQPSDRVVRLLLSEGVKLPKWVKVSESRAGKLRNPEKLRRNRPPEAEPVEAPKEAAAEASEVAAEGSASEEAPTASEEAPAEAEPAAEATAAPAEADEPKAESETPAAE